MGKEPAEREVNPLGKQGGGAAVRGCSSALVGAGSLGVICVQGNWSRSWLLSLLPLSLEWRGAALEVLLTPPFSLPPTNNQAQSLVLSPLKSLCSYSLLPIFQPPP